MKRSPLKRKTALKAKARIRPKARKPKRGVVRDPEYREWILQQSSLEPATGKMDLDMIQLPNVRHVEGHHVGHPKNDRRMVPLYWWMHRETKISVHGGGGNRKFQARFGVDFEVEIQKLNERYEAERRK